MLILFSVSLSQKSMQVQKEQETWIPHKNVEYINDWNLMIIRHKKTYKILS